METTRHHYVLAHFALRKFCQDDPLWFFGVMGSPQRDDFLDDVWRQVRENCDSEGSASFDISDVGITTLRIKGYPGILVNMPPPADTAEAYFAGILLKIDTNTDTHPENPEVAYITLEKGNNPYEAERTVLCGWTTDGTHVNYGDGPTPTQEAFIEAIEKMI